MVWLYVSAVSGSFHLALQAGLQLLKKTGQKVSGLEVQFMLPECLHQAVWYIWIHLFPGHLQHQEVPVCTGFGDMGVPLPVATSRPEGVHVLPGVGMEAATGIPGNQSPADSKVHSASV